MDDKTFVWTSELSQRLFELRFENDWIFKSKKQPWREFHKVLIEYNFPKEMTVDHVRKKWSYNLDMYKMAKKSNNTSWKYFEMFEKHFAKSKVLDKYESWTDEWRLKLIVSIVEAMENKLDPINMWRAVEQSMRSQDLPIDCCVQDMQGLWHHIKMIFNRKHRIKMKKGTEPNDWPLYETMLSFHYKFDPEYLKRLETEPANVFASCQKDGPRYSKKKKNKNVVETEFHWTKDITESFIQLRLQHDWLFKHRKWAWNELSKIMIEEYGFPKTLTSRELGRKWASTFAEYQKAKATNNTSWVYHNLFELYLGDSNLSLNPLVGWDEEWVFNLINARSDYEPLFRTIKDQNPGWREVEKRLRSIGLPLDHSLLDLPDIWTHLIKTYRWKQKFADKGMLEEQWPYFEAISLYTDVQEKYTQGHFENVSNYGALRDDSTQDDATQDDVSQDDSLQHFADADAFEDDIKLTDLKKRLQFEVDVEPKFEFGSSEQSCRSCANLHGCVDIFEQRDDEGLDVAFKLKVIAGIEVERFDNLPTNICLNCHEELENAYKFRRKCQYIDKQYRDNAIQFKMEISSKSDHDSMHNVGLEHHAMHNVESEDHAMHNVESEHHDIHNVQPEHHAMHNVQPEHQAVHNVEPENHAMHNVEFEHHPMHNVEHDHEDMHNVQDDMELDHDDIHDDVYDADDVRNEHDDNDVKVPYIPDTNEVDNNEKAESIQSEPISAKVKVKVKDKKQRKAKYHYWKICEVCGKHTRNLMNHLDTHTTDRAYSCDLCDKKFKFKSGLLIHKAVHNPLPKKTCEVCGKAFHILAQYRRHFVYHANERKYACDTCGKRFNTLDILRVHNRTHTDERPFTCEECGKTFRTAGCVSRHKRIVHRNIRKNQ